MSAFSSHGHRAIVAAVLKSDREKVPSSHVLLSHTGIGGSISWSTSALAPVGDISGSMSGFEAYTFPARGKSPVSTGGAEPLAPWMCSWR